MTKLDMKTPNFTDENIEKLAQLFPNIVTESKDEKGNIKKAIDFELLKQELSQNIVDGNKERYSINWPGKKEALLTANQPINKTLRPCEDESVDFENTGNLYIEGDNLEALKLLQESYLNKIKMIYIDPPYNTGKDFVYKDNFTQDKDEFLEDDGQKDEDGGRLVANLDSNGRYHSDWLSMMYPRLKLARNLLKDDGVIFISIDDNEVHNLRRICDEIFGEDNFRNSIIIKRGAKSVQSQFETWDKLGNGYETVLLYTKNSNYRFPKQLKKLEKPKEGSWNNHWRGTDRPTMRYEIFNITPETGQWRWGKERSLQAIKNYVKLLMELKKTSETIMQDEIDKWYLSQNENIDLLRLSKNNKPEHYIAPTDTQLLNDVWFDFPPHSSNTLIKLFDNKIFNNPKPFGLIYNILNFGNKNDIILDFFSGSATTAHAVMQLNAEDGGERKYICVQIPELTDEKSEAYKAGYKNICEIGKERIRRAGKKIVEDSGKEDLDIGFRVLKIDSSNMKDVYYTPESMSQSILDYQAQNIKEDRRAEDLLFQVLLDWGVDLTLPIVKEKIQGKTVYFVDEDTLVACFDDDLDAELAKEIAKREPLRVVFKESGYKQDEDKINIDQVIKQFSPDTEVRAI